jgi:hypothetical protein
MAMSVVLHRVADYDAWRKVYDGAAGIQKAGGVTAESVHRMADDPDNVLVIHHFNTIAEARTFFDNPGLKDAMVQGGVKGEPRIEFYE